MRRNLFLFAATVLTVLGSVAAAPAQQRPRAPSPSAKARVEIAKRQLDRRNDHYEAAKERYRTLVQEFNQDVADYNADAKEYASLQMRVAAHGQVPSEVLDQLNQCGEKLRKRSQALSVRQDRLDASGKALVQVRDEIAAERRKLDAQEAALRSQQPPHSKFGYDHRVGPRHAPR